MIQPVELRWFSSHKEARASNVKSKPFRLQMRVRDVAGDHGWKDVPHFVENYDGEVRPLYGENGELADWSK